MQIETLNRETMVTMIVESVREMIELGNRPMPEVIDEATSLVGQQAVLDSLALVTLIVDLEQRLEEEYGVVLTLTDDRAMSQRSSPFRTIGTLTTYLEQLLAEEQGNG